MAEQTLNPSILKDTREAKGLTLDIVHEATKIPMDVLKALEQGYSVRILSPFYYRGFVKIYSEFLGLDPKEVFKAYNIEKPSPVVVTATADFKPAPRPAVAKAATAVVSASVKEKATRLLSNIQARRQAAKPKTPWISKTNPFFDQTKDAFKGIATPANLQMLLRGVGLLVVVFVLFKAGGCITSNMKSQPKAKAPVAKAPVAAAKETREPPKVVKEVKKERPESEGVTVPAPPPVAQPVVAAAPVEQAKPAPAANKVQVVLRAKRDSWIQVKADDKVVFAMTMQKGTMEAWSAKEKIEVSGRNLGEFQWEINGKELAALGSAERRAKRVLITKDGLSVKK